MSHRVIIRPDAEAAWPRRLIGMKNVRLRGVTNSSPKSTPSAIPLPGRNGCSRLHEIRGQADSAEGTTSLQLAYRIPSKHCGALSWRMTHYGVTSEQKYRDGSFPKTLRHSFVGAVS